MIPALGFSFISFGGFRKMKYITSVFAMFVCGLALAQQSAVEPAAPVAPVPSVVAPAPAVPAVEETKFTFSLDSSVNFFDFDDGCITQIDTELLFDVHDNLKLGVGLPIYNVSDIRVGATGLADMDLFAVVNIIDGKCSYLCNDRVWVDFTGGVQVPLDGKYSSDTYVPHLGTEIGGEWGPVSLSYGFTYQIVDEFTFSPALGGTVYGDIYEGVATLGYQALDNLEVHFTASQYFWEGNDLLLLGPGFNYKVTDNFSFSADFAVPTTNDTAYSDLNICMSAGVQFDF